jgi:hypothetical protein
MKDHWMICGASALLLALGACSPPVTPAQDSGVPGADAQSEAAVSTPDASTTEDAAATGDSATSQDAAAAPVGSCQQMLGTVAYCIDYTGTGPTAEFVQMTCSMTMGTYAATLCATMNRVGRCTLDGATAVLTQTANYYAPTTVQEATMMCMTAGGTFVAD